MKTKNNMKISTNLLAQYNYNKGKVLLSLPEYYSAFKHKIERVLTKQDFSDDIDTLLNPPPYNKVNDIAIVSFSGFTVGNCSPLEEFIYGCVSLQGFCQRLQAAISDDSINSIVINFDSGGGYTSYGDETCQLVKDLSAIKPIYAYTSGYMCSMAYKVACNCLTLQASPSSLVGSIGTYCEYITYNGASQLSPDGVTVSNLPDLGVTVTTFQLGNQKTIGAETIALSDDQKKMIMSDLTKHGNEFKSLVIANRGNVKDEYLQGQPFLAKEAMELNTNLVDGNINSLNQFVELITKAK
jgi:ClpP class serine protease